MFFRGEKIVYVSTTSNSEISLKYLKKEPCLLFYILQNLYVRIRNIYTIGIPHNFQRYGQNIN